MGVIRREARDATSARRAGISLRTTMAAILFLAVALGLVVAIGRLVPRGRAAVVESAVLVAILLGMMRVAVQAGRSLDAALLLGAGAGALLVLGLGAIEAAAAEHERILWVTLLYGSASLALVAYHHRVLRSATAPGDGPGPAPPDPRRD